MADMCNPCYAWYRCSLTQTTKQGQLQHLQCCFVLMMGNSVEQTGAHKVTRLSLSFRPMSRGVLAAAVAMYLCCSLRPAVSMALMLMGQILLL